MASQPTSSHASYKKTRTYNQPGNYKKVTGTFIVPYKGSVGSTGDDSSEEDEAEESEGFLDYRDMQAGDNMVRAKVPNNKRVELKDKAGKVHTCHGRFLMTEPYWEVMVRMNKTFLRTAPVYSLRMDWEVMRSSNMVTIFLSDCLQICKDPTKQNGTQACFENYCRTLDLKNSLTFTELSNILPRYIEHEKTQGCFLGQSSRGGLGTLPLEDHSVYMKMYVSDSDLGASVLAAANLPQLVKTLSSLFQYTFPQILNKLSRQGKTQKRCTNEEENYFNGGDEESNKCNQQGTRLLKANTIAQDRPWEFCFKEIIKKKLKLYGVEATLRAYEDSDLLPQTPLTQKDALYIYEVMKNDAKRDGHAYIPFRTLRGLNDFMKLNHRIDGLERWKSALDYLEVNGVIKTEQFGGDSNIFLYHNWQAEVDTTEAVKSILERHQADPLIWDVNLFSPEFSHLRSDSDQLRACLLICSSPIVVMSGRGGCGKTTVITSLLKHLCNEEQKRIDKEREEEENKKKMLDCQNFEGGKRQTPATVPVFTDTNHSSVEARDLPSVSVEGSLSQLQLSAQRMTQRCKENHEVDAEDVKPDIAMQPQPGLTKVEILKREVVCDLLKILSAQSSERNDSALDDYKKTMLLTAPTGKAARLLGCKAGLPSATLHSVMTSWQMYVSQEQVSGEWKYAEVKILVVDECSLVSTRLFANVVKILLAHANLCKMVLLGDVRQLPSIEPGSFLKDMFRTLNHMGLETNRRNNTSVVSSGDNMFNLAVELSHNHRSESQLIVDNAELISRMKTPTFDSPRNFHLVKTPLQGEDNERDVAIRQILLAAPDLRSHVNSQFVAFRNAHCTAVNELCCQFYNGHVIKKPSKSGKRQVFDFRVGDKICLTKNNLVPSLHKVYLDKYRAEFPELQKALNKEEYRIGEQQRKKAEEKQRCGNGTGQGLNDKEGVKAQADMITHKAKGQDETKIGLDASGVLDLLDQDDATFDTTISEMKEQEEMHRRKEARRQRAQLQQQEWRLKSNKNAVMASLGKSQEKLCNGEVFFIMDELEHFEDQASSSRRQSNGAVLPRKYLLLSDRDPDMPRVVCVPFKDLCKLCKMRHSWARTIHTYQGSESDTVVYVLGGAIPQTWQHVYTAVTRGRKSVYILGDPEQLHVAVTRRDVPRRTRLSHRLQESLKDQAESVELCCQEFLKRQRADASVASASNSIDGTGEDFSFDDSWLEQAISQQEQASMDELPIDPGRNSKERNQKTHRESVTTSNHEDPRRDPNTAQNLHTPRSNQNIQVHELDRNCYINSGTDSEDEEESIYAPLHRYREKKGNASLQQTRSERNKEKEKENGDEDGDCVLVCGSQLMEDNIEVQVVHEKVLYEGVLPTISKCELDKKEHIMAQLDHGEADSNGLLQGMEQQKLKKTEEPVKAGPKNSSHSVFTPTKLTPVNNGPVNGPITPPRPVKSPEGNLSSPPNPSTLTPSKRLSATCGQWDVSEEVSPSKVQRTSNIVGTPFLESFSGSLSFDSERERGSSHRDKAQEESPFPVKRKL